MSHKKSNFSNYYKCNYFLEDAAKWVIFASILWNKNL